MKLTLTTVAVVALASALCSACNSANTSALLNNLQGCERHYDGAVSGGMTGGQFSGTIKVDCNSGLAVKPGAIVTPTAPATPPA